MQSLTHVQIKLVLQPSARGAPPGVEVKEGGIALGLTLTVQQESVLAKIKMEPGVLCGRSELHVPSKHCCMADTVGCIQHARRWHGRLPCNACR